MRVTEIFTSIDGEVNMAGQGCLSTFIRLSGCNLRCSYCDTPRSQSHSIERDNEYSVAELFQEVEKRVCHKVTITGGEPLLQAEELFRFIDLLINKGYTVTVETNGTRPIPYLYVRKPSMQLGWVVDYKMECEEQMSRHAFISLPSHNWVKILIGNKNDYNKAKGIISKLRTEWYCHAKIALSPIFGTSQKPKIDPTTLVEWLIQDGLFDIYINVQIHKIIGVR